MSQFKRQLDQDKLLFQIDWERTKGRYLNKSKKKLHFVLDLILTRDKVKTHQEEIFFEQDMEAVDNCASAHVWNRENGIVPVSRCPFHSKSGVVAIGGTNHYPAKVCDGDKVSCARAFFKMLYYFLCRWWKSQLLKLCRVNSQINNGNHMSTVPRFWLKNTTATFLGTWISTNERFFILRPDC